MYIIDRMAAEHVLWAWAAAFMWTRAKIQIAAGDRARHQNVPDTSGITAVELKIEGVNLWRMPIDTIREIRYSTDI